MKRPPLTLALLVILALSALLSIGFAWASPVGAAPDEGAHLRFVEVLATEARLPRLNTQRRRDPNTDPNYEFHQPPLYYVLAVPFYHVGRALGGNTGAGQGCRVLSILIGLAGTALVWLLAREVAPRRPALWIAATAVAAFLPMRLAVMASVSNDTLTEAAGSLALLLMLRALSGDWSPRRAVWLGLALGLALLSKQSSIMLLPPALLTLYLASRAAPAAPPVASRSGKKGAKGRARSEGLLNEEPMSPAQLQLFRQTAVAMGGVVLLVCGWWFARNHVLYGDPLGMRVFNWYFEDTPRWAQFKEMGWPFTRYLGQLVLPVTFASFWGAFGHLDPRHPELFMGWYQAGSLPQPWDSLAEGLQVLWPVGNYPPRSWVYPLLVVTLLLAVSGGMWYYGRQRRHGLGLWGRSYAAEALPAEADAPQARAAKVGVLALHGIFVVAAFLNLNATYFQGQGRYLFPAIGILSIGLAGGWLELGRARERRLSWIIAGFFLLLSIYALFGVVQPAFQTP